jgi:N-acyl-D-amino-acid deacylase
MLVGLDVLSAADGQDPVDFLCDLLVAERLDVMLLGVSSGDSRSVPDLIQMLRGQWHIMGSDGIYRPGRAHPRGCGAFARFVSWLVREEAGLTLEDAVAHATGRAAERFGLLDRGFVRPGLAADLILLDPSAYGDRSTLDRPSSTAEGVRYVLVNGVPALEDGEPTGARPGRGLRRTPNAATLQD